MRGQRRPDELAKAQQRISIYGDRRSHGQICPRKLSGKRMLLDDLGVTPARRPVKFENQRSFSPAELIDPILITIERKQNPVALESHRSRSIEHQIRREA